MYRKHSLERSKTPVLIEEARCLKVQQNCAPSWIICESVGGAQSTKHKIWLWDFERCCGKITVFCDVVP